MPVTLTIDEFCKVLKAAHYGIELARGYASDAIIDDLQANYEMLMHKQIDDGRTQPERDASATKKFYDDCARFGAD